MPAWLTVVAAPAVPAVPTAAPSDPSIKATAARGTLQWVAVRAPKTRQREVMRTPWPMAVQSLARPDLVENA